MADLTVTAAQLRIMESIEARLIPMIANVAITKGQAVYRLTTGRAALARANAVGTAKVVGIATTSVPAGTAFEALYHGRFAGYNVDTMDPGETVYLSVATAGALTDTVPATSTQVVVGVGTVHTMTDGTDTPFLFVDVPQNATYVAI